MIVSNELFSPQAYLEEVTGECYIVDGEDDYLTILSTLKQNNKNKHIYRLKEIDKIIEGEFVLVECMGYDQIEDNWYKELLWCEI